MFSVQVVSNRVSFPAHVCQATAALVKALTKLGLDHWASAVEAAYVHTGDSAALTALPWELHAAEDPLPPWTPSPDNSTISAAAVGTDGSPESTLSGVPSAGASAGDPDHIFVIDTFAFNGEKIAELRLLLLAPYVDAFYVVEARLTHAGSPKAFLHSEMDSWRRVFGLYGDKVRVVIVDAFPEVPLVRHCAVRVVVIRVASHRTETLNCCGGR